MIQIVKIGNKNIVVRGIGKLFYQEGFPITMSIQHFKEQGIEVSLLHIVDELIKHGWTNKTILNKLRNDAQEGINNEINNTNWEMIEKFCSLVYEEQREMIFEYLFKSKEQSLDWLKENYFKN